MKKMITGIESEYSGSFESDSKSSKKADRLNFNKFIEDFGKVFAGLRSDFFTSSQFCINGGRLYIDTGGHLEFATPECNNAEEAVKYLRAGDVIVENYYRKGMEERMIGRGYEGKLIFRRDITAYDASSSILISRTTYSAHENYLTTREVFDGFLKNFRNISNCLAAFNATRIILSGSGCIFLEPHEDLINQVSNFGFVLSPRAFFIEVPVSSSTTSARALVGLRDEPHADKNKYGRLHIIAGDANRSDWSNWLKIGLTGLIVSIFNRDLEVFYDPLLLKDPVSEMRQLSALADPNKKIFHCYNRPYLLSAVDIQRWFLERVKMFLTEEKRDEEDKNLINVWERILNALEDEDDEELDQLLDWKIKLRLFRHYKEKKGLKCEGFLHPKLAQQDIEYHNISSSGIFSIMENEGFIQKMIPDLEIKKAVWEPPLTRAFLRHLFLQIRKKIFINADINWDSIKVINEGEIFLMSDPFSTSHRKLEEWVNRYKDFK